jgi:hypothetical protein
MLRGPKPTRQGTPGVRTYQLWMTRLNIFNYNSQVVPQLYNRHRADIGAIDDTQVCEFLLHFWSELIGMGG